MSRQRDIVELPLEIDRGELLHFLEYPPGTEPPPRIARIARATLAEASTLVRARGSFAPLAVDRAADIGLRPVEAERLVVGLVTAGPAIEARASELSKSGQLTRALVMDACGSAAAEQAADLLGAVIAGHQAQPRARLSCRLSPGYGGWKLDAQPALFALLPHRALGVELLPSMLMMPRKSISFAMWLGAAGPIGTGIAGCARCSLAHCRYRRAPMRTDDPSPHQGGAHQAPPRTASHEEASR